MLTNASSAECELVLRSGNLIGNNMDVNRKIAFSEALNLFNNSGVRAVACMFRGERLNTRAAENLNFLERRRGSE